MIYVNLPTEETRQVSFYLAMEEYVARHFEAKEYFFIWQVEPSVIFGRNQLIGSEVNTDYCKAHGIQTFRRKSGGGCVYADMSNLMLSYITKSETVGFSFHKYINMIVLVLRKLGVEAQISGRNDIMIGERKVSGTAFYRTPGRSIVHGTLLYDTNLPHMVGSITPSDEKLVSKGVNSVRQRIALLKDHISASIDEVKSLIRQTLCHDSITLTEEDIKNIEEMEKEYHSPDFIYGNNPRYTTTRRKRIEGVGEMEARLEIKNGTIKKVNLLGDFFIVGDIDEGITQRLIGVQLTAEAISAALPDDLSVFISGLQKEDFVRLLTAPTTTA